MGLRPHPQAARYPCSAAAARTGPRSSVMASLARQTGAALRQVGRHAAREAPAGVELGLTCEECFERLDRYVELELAGRDADAAVPGMRAHLEGCPACHDDHDSLAALVGSE